MANYKNRNGAAISADDAALEQCAGRAVSDADNNNAGILVDVVAKVTATEGSEVRKVLTSGRKGK
jgi:hypothetical protein